MKKTLIIAGSARNDGNTKTLIDNLKSLSQWNSIELNDYKIGHYDYEHTNRDDDFLPLIREIVTKYDVFVFATPVYWYTMSGVMKMFFDRFTDLITIEKPLGRQLRGKQMGVITTSAGGNLGEDFWIPFQHIANYLGMTYSGHCHTLANKLHTESLQSFIRKVNK